MLRLPEPKPGTINEGHVEIGAQTGVPELRTEAFPAGSVRVPSDQPLGLVAAHLLEPGSPVAAGLGLFPQVFQRTEYIEGYAIAPLADKMLAQDPALKAAFEAKLAADPDFAKTRTRGWNGSTSARPITMPATFSILWGGSWHGKGRADQSRANSSVWG
ncbi:hypothetical protein [Hankyongella ginsenosidimutans]|uniref:hypothetical protein n=1 Tax=Hankyongella ginsenosidimutans TaxID=1763828 RepID=UPI001FE9D2EF|nr:hypothetical protein [Hankyongella ginsenosidimutans]